MIRKTRTTFAGLASLALLAGSVPIALAALTQDAPLLQMEKTVHKGTIVSTSPTNNRFVLEVEEETRAEPGVETKRVVVRVDETTTYTLDGEDSTIEEAVQPGRRATVEMSEGVASRVEVTTEDE